MHMRLVPSRLRTTTKGDEYGDSDGRMTFMSIILWISSCKDLRTLYGTRYGLQRTGISAVNHMPCFVKFVPGRPGNTTQTPLPVPLPPTPDRNLAHPIFYVLKGLSSQASAQVKQLIIDHCFSCHPFRCFNDGGTNGI